VITAYSSFFGFTLPNEQASRTLISGNKIGTNKDGTGALPNGGAGIHLLGDVETVDTTTVSGNLIAGNAGAGVLLAAAGTITTLVQRNTLGALGLPNGNSGVAIINGAANNTIGGTDPSLANTIAYNTVSGVAVGDGSSAQESAIVGNAIWGNSIYGNGG